jgi:transcriptional regulator with XRE-family HTH domain
VANPIDVNVGTRLSLARHMSSLSQETLGAAEGLTFQQIQEYERGSNRIGTSRLYQCAEFLNLTGYFFFEEIPDEIKSLECVYKKGMMDSEQSDIDVDPLGCRKRIELVENNYHIPDPQVRRNIYELKKTLACSPKHGGNGIE